MNEKEPDSIEGLMKKYNISESEARFSLALGRGEISGDFIAMPSLENQPSLSEQVEIDRLQSK